MDPARQPKSDQPPSPQLPALRQELRVERGLDAENGAATWLIVDSAQHRYIQINEQAYHLLSRWQEGMTHAELCARVARDFGDEIGLADLDALVGFVASNNLTVEPMTGDWRHYAGIADRSRHGWLMWLIHNYLFIKLPLVRPEPWLKRMLPVVAPLYTRACASIIVTIGIVGIYLVSRQWDAFSTTFQHFFSWQGIATYAAGLILIKSAHELGHAFTAARLGCRVPSMGVCFLVMFPVLYTDVTDAWRLRQRRDRLMIGGAGVAVELSIACLATFLWAFLPEGPMKSLAFSLATVGWILSLAINLNPLMRFDGYYLFADALGIDNLQARAFAFGQWRMREFLFGLRRPAPEQLSPRMALTLTIYAWLTWLYRFIVFTGIAILVYHMAFKLLGIALFLVEIIYFIIRPIANEIRDWRTDAASIRATRRSRLTLATASAALLAVVVPWSTSIQIPAVVEASALARVYPQRGGVVQRVHVKPGDAVSAGDPLVTLASPETEHRRALTRGKLALIKMRLARRSSDTEDRAKSLVMQQEMRALTAALDGLNKELSDLTIRAPHDGTIVELNGSVHSGRTIGRAEFIGLIRGPGALVARGYIAQDDIARLHGNNVGRFIFDNPDQASIPVRLESVSQAGAPQIEMPELTSHHGGTIAVRPASGDGPHRRLVPIKANYLATMTVGTGEKAPAFSARGVAILKGDSQSIAGRAWQQIAAVLVRESGL